MKKTAVFGIIAIVILVLIVIAFLPGDNNSVSEVSSENSGIGQVEQGNGMEDSGSMMEHSEYIIEMSSEGFFPEDLTISPGDTVAFVAVDDTGRWPASDNHPTHTVYPGSDIKKCGSDDSIFDSCGTISQGNSYRFTFNEEGQWGYHDHKSPRKGGIITVQ